MAGLLLGSFLRDNRFLTLCGDDTTALMLFQQCSW